jgi:hypothetical protein
LAKIVDGGSELRESGTGQSPKPLPVSENSAELNKLALLKDELKFLKDNEASGTDRNRDTSRYFDYCSNKKYLELFTSGSNVNFVKMVDGHSPKKFISQITEVSGQDEETKTPSSQGPLRYIPKGFAVQTQDPNQRKFQADFGRPSKRDATKSMSIIIGGTNSHIKEKSIFLGTDACKFMDTFKAINCKKNNSGKILHQSS